jgi:hypothetical protein
MRNSSMGKVSVKNSISGVQLTTIPISLSITNDVLCAVFAFPNHKRGMISVSFEKKV